MKVEIETTNEIISTHGGNLLLGAILDNTELRKRVNEILGEQFPPPYSISTGNVIVAYIGMLSQGTNSI